MNQIHKARLLKLADFLENTVPKKHFDLDHFTRDNDLYDTPLDNFTKKVVDEEYKVLLKKLNKIKKDFKPHTCGAVACAVGWFPAVFPRSFMWNEDTAVILKTDINKKYANVDFDVVESFLGIDEDQVHRLFTSDFYPLGKRGPKSVAKKIKNFVKTGKLSDKMYETVLILRQHV